MMLILLVTLAYAESHTDTFGGDDEWRLLDDTDFAGMCFSVDVKVTLTELRMYLRRAAGETTELSFGYWQDQGVDDWASEDYVSVDSPDTSGEWVSSGGINWRLSEGEHYCVGVYSDDRNATYVRAGDEHEDDNPGFGESWGDCTVIVASAGNALHCTNEPGWAAEYYMELVYTASDRDDDGYDVLTDCDDDDDDANPGEEEDWYNGVDEDCDGNDADQDGDGYDAEEAGGDDCDDDDEDVSPGKRENWYDGVDQDCDGNDSDRDEDGYDAEEAGGRDCDDRDAGINPGEEDTPYDGEDVDCSGSDYDYDEDGYDSTEYDGKDCDDANEDVNPGEDEVWYDGVDQNCDGANDFDADGDGYAVSGDCNDLNPGAWTEGDPDCAITPSQGDGCDGCGGSSKEGALALISLAALGVRRRRLPGGR